MAETERRTIMKGDLTQLRGHLVEYLHGAVGLELHPRGSRLVGYCPVHEDRKPSFAVFGRDRELCGCFPCGFSGDVFDVSQWLGRSSTFSEALKDVSTVLGLGVPNSKPVAPPQVRRHAKAAVQPYVLDENSRQKIHSARLAFSDAMDAGGLDFVSKELGLPLSTLRWCARGRSGLGWFKGRLAYLYPEGMKLRNPAGHHIRFVWECGKATAPWRFEWVTPDTQTVYLTEGESDCMALVAAGLESEGIATCVASPGTSFPVAYASLFAGKRVTLCFDYDAPGQAATERVARLLQGHAKEILNWKGPAGHE